MSSTERIESVPESEHDRALLYVARESIRHGLAHGTPLQVEPERFAPALREHRASFVTLHRHGVLRGCIGVLEPVRPLIEDVAQNAFAAAFRDPRFEPLSPLELEGLLLQISLLSGHEPIAHHSERHLLEQLRPGVDGLILEWEGGRGTFLPAVWQSLKEPQQFLSQLKVKAGLEPDAWPPSLHALRYTCRCLGPVAAMPMGVGGDAG